MSILDSIKPGASNGLQNLKIAKRTEEQQAITLDDFKNKSIFDTFKAGTTSNAAKMDQAEAAKETAKNQYTLADMKIFHQEDNAFKSILSTGKLMA